jgi:hypothetical protein
LASENAKKNQKADDQKVNHFWAMVVWNYKTSRLEVLEITQKTIQSSLRDYSTMK